MPIKYIYGVECIECKKRMFSFHVHDFKYCGCENETFVDGGSSYLRCGWITTKPRRIRWSEKRDGIYPVVKYKDSFPY